MNSQTEWGKSGAVFSRDELIEQLEWAEAWFDTTPGDANGAIPVMRDVGLSMFRSALRELTASQDKG